MSTKRSLILQKVQLLHNCTSVYIIVPMLTYKKIHFVYKKDTALVCHTLPFCKIWRRHVEGGGGRDRATNNFVVVLFHYDVNSSSIDIFN